jgi:hypothetical protein
MGTEQLSPLGKTLQEPLAAICAWATEHPATEHPAPVSDRSWTAPQAIDGHTRNPRVSRWGGSMDEPVEVMRLRLLNWLQEHEETRPRSPAPSLLGRSLGRHQSASLRAFVQFKLRLPPLPLPTEVKQAAVKLDEQGLIEITPTMTLPDGTPLPPDVARTHWRYGQHDFDAYDSVEVAITPAGTQWIVAHRTRRGDRAARQRFTHDRLVSWLYHLRPRSVPVDDFLLSDTSWCEGEQVTREELTEAVMFLEARDLVSVDDRTRRTLRLTDAGVYCVVLHRGSVEEYLRRPGVHMDNSIHHIENSTVTVGSVVIGSLNGVPASERKDVTALINEIEALIAEEGNRAVRVLLQEFTKELDSPKKDNGARRSLWDAMVQLMPVLEQAANIAVRIAPLL